MAKPRLTLPQKLLLAEVVMDGYANTAEQYRPTRALNKAGLVTLTPLAWNRYRLEPTDAGREYVRTYGTKAEG